MAWLLLLKNKAVLYAVAAALLVFSGWHAHSIYDGYVANKDKTRIIKKLGAGQNEIIKFNQQFDEEKANVEDSCFSKSIPDALLRLLK